MNLRGVPSLLYLKGFFGALGGRPRRNLSAFVSCFDCTPRGGLAKAKSTTASTMDEKNKSFIRERR